MLTRSAASAFVSPASALMRPPFYCPACPPPVRSSAKATATTGVVVVGQRMPDRHDPRVHGRQATRATQLPEDHLGIDIDRWIRPNVRPTGRWLGVDPGQSSHVAAPVQGAD